MARYFLGLDSSTQSLSAVLIDLVARRVAVEVSLVFNQALPLLRRTFATFAPAERRAVGERARRGPGVGRRELGVGGSEQEAFDEGRGAAVLPLVARLLGL